LNKNGQLLYDEAIFLLSFYLKYVCTHNDHVYQVLKTALQCIKTNLSPLRGCEPGILVFGLVTIGMKSYIVHFQGNLCTTYMRSFVDIQMTFYHANALNVCRIGVYNQNN
jgi:hypothetical protein